MNTEDKIKLANLHQQLHVIKNTDPARYEQICKSYEENVEEKYQKEELFKSWSSDLQSKFPDGGWRTINGAKVFINNGKVVAGLDGFNKEIDKFFCREER